MSEIKFGKPYKSHITIDPSRPSFGKEYECYPVLGTQFEGLEVYKSGKRWYCHVRYEKHAFGLWDSGAKTKAGAVKMGMTVLWRNSVFTQDELLEKCKHQAGAELRLLGAGT